MLVRRYLWQNLLETWRRSTAACWEMPASASGARIVAAMAIPNTCMPQRTGDRWQKARLGWACIAALLLITLQMLPARTAQAGYASVVIDAGTGQILHAINPDEINYPASLTKMMTLYLTFDALSAGRLWLMQEVPVSAQAARQSPTKLGLAAGSGIVVEDAILAVITKSANDMAVVLAEAIAGSEAAFADRMTRKAHQLGMSATVFRNASGLPDPEQETSARDMAILAQALIVDHPSYYPFFGRAEFSYQNAVHANHNQLMLRFKGMDGIKTGYIRASGFNLVASAVHNGRRLIGVVMGGTSARLRDDHMAHLLTAAFEAKTPKDAPKVTERSPAAITQMAALVPLPVWVPMPVTARKTPDSRPKNPGSTVVATATRSPPRPLTSTREAGDTSAGVPRPTAHTQKGWSVQVGSFRQHATGAAAANGAARHLSSLVAGAATQVTPITTANGTLYRARLSGLDERTAHLACERLKNSGTACITVKP